MSPMFYPESPPYTVMIEFFGMARVMMPVKVPPIAS